jgi:hypothetical protein
MRRGLGGKSAKGSGLPPSRNRLRCDLRKLRKRQSAQLALASCSNTFGNANELPAKNSHPPAAIFVDVGGADKAATVHNEPSLRLQLFSRLPASANSLFGASITIPPAVALWACLVRRRQEALAAAAAATTVITHGSCF